MSRTTPDEDPVAEALAVMDRHLVALNAGDQAGMTDELHFPHYRLARGRLQVWEKPDTYLAVFWPTLARAGTTGSGPATDRGRDEAETARADRQHSSCRG